MSTQHPDNAGNAYWCNKSFINTADEIEEAYHAFKELGCDEYMWDWEGKLVDEAVIDKFFSRYTAYFKKHPLGKEKFLTYRIPNIWEERGYRLARVFINILTSSDLARDLKLHAPPIIEIILPMTKSAQQIIKTEETFRKVARLKCEVFNDGKHCSTDCIQVIPLIERIEDLTDADRIIEPYLKSYKETHKVFPQYLRPFIARSDPALNSGLIPAVLASKAAISHFYNLEKKFGVAMYPIIGTGSLPFRGSMNPENIKEAIKEYRGIRTVTIQSAFKYDYPQKMVREALSFIKRTLPKLKPEILSKEDIETIKKLNQFFIKPYTAAIEKLAPFINKVAAFVPPRRERMLHIGLFGYSRGMGKINLPRAITFNAVFYSLGVPPEFIGTGRGLCEAQKHGHLDFLKRVYVNLERDLTHAGKYLNKENLKLLAKEYPEFTKIAEDIDKIERILGIKLEPHKPHHFLHRNATSNSYYKLRMGQDISADLLESAKLRKSLG
ncbi:MAG: phosphoenolpyruvate carboxylase [Patescibacteria group bacterium]